MHNQNLTLYCANDGNLIGVATIGTATVIDDSEYTVKFSEPWYKNAFLHRMLELVRDYLQHPIWSAKKLQADPKIEIPDSHFKRIVDKVNRIAGSFESYCKNYAVEHKINTHFAMMNINIMVVCWKQCEEAAVLLTDLVHELLLDGPTLGVFQMINQRQVYLQILLYTAFLGRSRGPTAHAKQRLLPVLHKELFNIMAQREAAAMASQGEEAHVHSTGPTLHAMNLQAAVAQLRPSFDDMVSAPGVHMPIWIQKCMLNHPFDLILVPDPVTGKEVPMGKKHQLLGEIIEEDADHLPSVLWAIQIPQQPLVHIIPAPGHRVTTLRPLPKAVRVAKLNYLEKKEEQKSKKRGWHKMKKKQDDDLTSDEGEFSSGSWDNVGTTYTDGGTPWPRGVIPMVDFITGEPTRELLPPTKGIKRMKVQPRVDVPEPDLSKVSFSMEQFLNKDFEAEEDLGELLPMAWKGMDTKIQREENEGWHAVVFSRQMIGRGTGCSALPWDRPYKTYGDSALPD